MTDFEKAIYDLDKIITHMRGPISRNDLSGAVPMPLRTVKHSFESLSLEDAIFDKLDGFEVNMSRAEKRLTSCEDSIQSQCDLSNLDSETLAIAMGVLKMFLNRYYKACSMGYHNANRRNH